MIKGSRLISVEEAQAIIDQVFKGRQGVTEVVDSENAIGRILGEDLVATTDYPAFDKSTMDGYALSGRSFSKGKYFKVVGEVFMGTKTEQVLHEGEAMYVPTGAMLPKGTQTVVKIEDTLQEEGQICLSTSVMPKENIIFKGEDIETGQVALHKGEKIDALKLGYLSLLGISELKVYKKPRIAILTTGDELVGPFEEAPEGKIRDINAMVLKGMAEACGAEVILQTRIKDEEKDIENTLLKAVQKADLVVTSGASSMGKKDVIPDLLEKHGDQIYFHGLNIKPGKPVGFSMIENTPVVALPGNPVSSIMTFILIVEYMLEKIGGHRKHRVEMKCIANGLFKSVEGKDTYIAVKLQPSGEFLLATPILGKSGLISIAAEANGFVKVPANSKGFKMGTPIWATSF